MEEQPIDNLFKRKLAEAEIAPSDSVWSTIQARHGRKRLIPVWVYMAVAASLLLVCSIGWWSLQKEDTIKPIAKAKTLAPVIKLPIIDDETVAQSIKKQPHHDIHVKVYTQGKLQVAKAQEKSKRLINKPTDFSKPKAVTKISTDLIAKRLEATQTITKVATAIAPIPVLTYDQKLSKEPEITTAERTLIVSINLPTNIKTTPVELVAKSDTSAHRNGLGNLLKKVKRLKEGDVLALGNLGSSKVNRRGFSKLYEDVKESIKNNSAE